MAEPWGVYLRISRARDGSTLGVERQQPPTEALVARMGGEVTKVYTDNDLSAYSGKRRPAYEQMLADAKAGTIRGVAAWHPDRLTRQLRENEALIDLVNAYGVKLATALVGDHDLATVAGRTAFRLQGVIAAQESEHRGERLRLKYDQLAEAGLPKGTGKRPFGYRGIELVPEEAALLREAATRLLDKGETLGAIVRDWNARGIPTTTGRRWTVSVLRRTLQNPRLYGARVHRGAVVGPAAWPPVLDRGTFDALQRLFADPERRAGGAPERHLLSGVLVCGQSGCGAKLYWRRKSGRAVYVCLPRAQGGCGRTSVDAARIEAWLSAAVLKAFDSEKFAAILHGEADQQGRARLGARLTQLEADQREAYDDYRVHRVINRAQYLAANAKLESQLRAVRRELDRLDRAQMVLELPAGTSTLRQAWAVAAGDIDWQRRAVKLALVKVTVLPKVSGARPRFTPDRLDPDWRA